MYTFLLLILYKRLASLQFIIATNADTVKEICFTYFKKCYPLSPERRLVMIFIKYNLTVQQLKSELSGMDKICATVPVRHLKFIKGKTNFLFTLRDFKIRFLKRKTLTC